MAGVSSHIQCDLIQAHGLLIGEQNGHSVLDECRFTVLHVDCPLIRNSIREPIGTSSTDALLFRLPLPDTAQFVYSEKDDPTNPAKKIFQFNALESGNMVPLPPFDPKDERNNIIDFAKSSEFFYNVMRSIARIFSNTTVLGTLSLGALGNLIEFTIHNWMHNRWANDNGATLQDPKSGDLKQRDTFDFDPMWDDPKYDYLGEFYSSHVNPLFWRLHGWVDDRIEDWFNAHESMQPGEIERRDYNGVSWFKPGKWVQVEKPFYWPEDMHHHFHDLHNNNDNDNEQKIVENILKVMDIIKAARNAFVMPPSDYLKQQ